MIVTCYVFCRNTSGETDMVTVNCNVSKDNYALGEHYDLAEHTAEEMGFQGPFLISDEHECLGSTMKHNADYKFNCYDASFPEYS